MFLQLVLFIRSSRFYGHVFQHDIVRIFLYVELRIRHQERRPGLVVLAGCHPRRTCVAVPHDVVRSEFVLGDGERSPVAILLSRALQSSGINIEFRARHVLIATGT